MGNAGSTASTPATAAGAAAGSPRRKGGGSGASAGGSSSSAGFGSIPNQLMHLRLRSGDPVIAIGMMQQVTAACNRSEADRQAFFDVMVGPTKAAAPSASYATTSGTSRVANADDDEGYRPLADLFLKVRVSSESSLRAMALAWVKILHDVDVNRAIGPLLDCGVVPFFIEIYAFQARSHMPLDALALMAALIARLSAIDAFVDACVAADALRPIAQRIKFTIPGTERANLIDALAVAAERDGGIDALAKGETAEILLRCAVDRAEGSTIVIARCCKMLADITTFRRQSNNVITNPRQLVAILCLYEKGVDVYPSVSALLCALIDCDPTSGGSRKIEAEVARHFHLVFGTKFVEHEGIAPEHMLQLAQLAIRSEKDARIFVSSHQLASVSRRMGRYISTSPAAVRQYLRLLLELAEYDSLIESVAESGALDFLLMVVEMCPSESYGAVRLMTKLCRLDSVSKVLLQQRRFHTLLRQISPKGTDEQTQTALEAMKILKFVYTPAVLRDTDAMQIDAIQSLLCQALSQCPMPAPRPVIMESSVSSSGSSSDDDDDESKGDRIDDGAAAARRRKSRSLKEKLQPEAPAPEQILEIVLSLLAWRAAESAESALTILAQAPLDHLRLLIMQPHAPNIAELAAKLRDNIAQASPEAAEELRFYGCVAQQAVIAISAMAFQSRGKITLRMLQRHWRTVYRSRVASRFRSRVAALYKDFFLIHTDLLEAERGAYKQLTENVSGQMVVLREHHEERTRLADQAVRDVEAVAMPERHERDELHALFLEGVEDIERCVVERAEESGRSFIPRLAQVSVAEVAGRNRETTAQTNEFGSILSRHAMRIRVIDKLYEHRQGISAEELRGRAAIQFERAQRHAYHQRLFALYKVQVAEFVARRDIIGERRTLMRDVLCDLYPLLIEDTIATEAVRRTELVVQHEVTMATAGELLAIFGVHHAENLLRREHEEWELRLRCALLVALYSAATSETVVDEQRKRMALLREWTAGSKVLLAAVPRLRLGAVEGGARKGIVLEYRVRLNALAEAWRTTLPRVCELEELSARRKLLVLHDDFRDAQLLHLSTLHLLHDEVQCRNAIAMQWYFTARNLVVPFAVLRLHLCAHVLLQDDLQRRAQIWVDEDFAFFLILQRALAERQKIHRVAIAREQGEGHELLARHFLSVTHVMRIKAEAHQFLARHDAVSGRATSRRR